MEKLINKLKETLTLLKGCHGKVEKQGDMPATAPIAADTAMGSDVNATFKFDQENMDMNKREEIIKALDKAGHRESALKLKNWGEMDSIAKTFAEKL